MKNFLKRYVWVLLVLMLAVSIPVGVTWAKYASTHYVDDVVLKVQGMGTFTIDKGKMWSALSGLQIRPTAIKLCMGKDVPAPTQRRLVKYVNTTDSDQIGLYTSRDGKTVYIAPIGNKNAKMYTQADCSAMFQYEKIGYNDATVSQLTAIDGLSNLITENATDMSDMFGGCKAVQELDVSGFNTREVTNMRDMFGGCKAVQTLDVSGFDTSKVTNMKGMFGDCQKLTGLNVSRFNTANVISMFEMFYNCQSLTSLDVSRFDTSNVLNLQEMFLWCSGLTELDLSSFKISPNLTNIAFMFENCQKLEKLTLGSNFNPGNSIKLKSLRHLFNECHSLETLDLSNFDTSRILDTWGMFGNCQRLTTIYASEKFVLAQVEDNYYPGKWNGETFSPGDTSQYMFAGCTNVLVGGNGTRFDSTMTDKTYALIDKPGQKGYFTAKFTTDDYILDTNKMQKALDDLPTKPDKVTICKSDEVPAGTLIATVEEEGSRWVGLYKGEDNNVYIAPIGGGTAPVYAQTDSTGLFDKSKTGTDPTEIDLSNLDTSRVETMVDMFKDCAKLKTIYTDDKFSTDKVTSSDGMFTGCTKLEGGEGTKYDNSKTDKEYAHVDGGTANPGYFTANPAGNAADLTKTVTVDLNGLSNIDAAPVN